MVDVETTLAILNSRKDCIVSELQACETYSAAIDEVGRSKVFLETINSQSTFIKNSNVSYASVFLPLNQPLYSFFLQVFSVALVSERVVFRPPQALQKVYIRIYEHFQQCFDNIDLFCGTRNDFLNNYVSDSEIINFTGKYENALSIVRGIKPNQFMIYNGSAINPIVVDSDADIPLSSVLALEACFYNSGQDCMAPAMLFLHDSISDSFIASLKNLVQKLCVDDYSNPKSSVGPLISKDAFQDAVTFINDNEKRVVFGGEYDEERILIYPTAFLYEDCSCICEKIFYAPLILAYVFKDIHEVTCYLKSPFAQIYKGYISYFGEKSTKVFSEDYELPLLLHNSTLIEYEHPTKEFGGYGDGCSFTCFNGRITAKPILLLRDIYEWKTKYV